MDHHEVAVRLMVRSPWWTAELNSFACLRENLPRVGDTMTLNRFTGSPSDRREGVTAVYRVVERKRIVDAGGDLDADTEYELVLEPVVFLC